jgi:hypothetical protein
MCARIRAGWPPLITGIALLLACLAVRLCCSADEQQTWLFGHAFGAECAFRLRFGIPCPNCGMTRAVIVALHGQWLRAWRIAPGGAAFVAATLVSAATLIALGIVRMRSAGPLAAKAERQAPRTIYACAVLVLMVWFAGWIAAVAQALAAR